MTNQNARTSSTHPRTRVEIPPENHTWEHVDDNIDRLKVPGGWIYYHTTGLGTSAVYVPSPGAHR